jgi:D-alanine-D-alanine ligase
LSITRVAVIFGGRSVEHEISILSARSIVSHIDRDRFEVFPIYIEKNGKWRAADTEGWLEDGGFEFYRDSFLSPSLNPEEGVFYEITGDKVTGEHEIGAVFPVLHGTYGEDGTVQGLLELMGVPFVGASVLGSSVGMDKIVMKAVLKEAGLPVVDYIDFYKSEWESSRSRIRARILEDMNFPCFVKSADLGSSIGISKVNSESTLDEAVNLSCRFSSRILVEKAVIAPREIEISVLGNDEPAASCPGEIVPKREFYDYTAKYLDEGTGLIAPAELDQEVTSRLSELAVGAFKALDCSGMGRVDFLMETATNAIFISEINTIPGFTQISMYPKLWELSGIPYTELITRLIELAIERNESQRSLKVDITDIQKTPSSE